MPIVHHRKPSFSSLPIWVSARMVLRPTLALWPLTPLGMKPLRLFDKLARRAPRPSNVVCEAISLAGRPVDLMMPRGPRHGGSDTAMLYLHGGAFVVGGRGTHRPLVSDLCELTELPVFSLDYRQLPEAGVGTSVHDAFSAYRELLEQRGYRHIVLAGDSAGGFLSGKIIELAAQNDLVAPVAYLSFSPLLDLDLAANPERSSRADAYVPIAKMAALAPMFDWGPVALTGVRRIADIDSTLFPPTLMITAEDEMIEPDALELIATLDAAGVHAIAHSYSWQVHAFPVFSGMMHAEGAHAVRTAAAFATEAIREARTAVEESDQLTG